MITTLVVEDSPSGAACAPPPLDPCLPAGFGQVAVKLELQGNTRAVRVVYRCGVVDMDVKASSKIQGLCPVQRCCGLLPRRRASLAPASLPRLQLACVAGPFPV